MIHISIFVTSKTNEYNIYVIFPLMLSCIKKAKDNEHTIFFYIFLPQFCLGIILQLN